MQMDVINLVSKVPGLPDAPITEPGEKYQPAAEFYANGYVGPLKRYRLFTKIFQTKSTRVYPTDAPRGPLE